MRKTTKERERDAARAARNDRVQEVVYLLSLLTRTKEWATLAHLAPVEHTTAGGDMNLVLCLHVDNQRLVTRISDSEADAYFGHLSNRQCPRGCSRPEKMAILEQLAQQGLPA